MPSVNNTILNVAAIIDKKLQPFSPTNKKENMTMTGIRSYSLTPRPFQRQKGE